MTVFADPDIVPTPTAIAAALGPAAAAWGSVTASFDAVGASPVWRHYRDGGWLLKAAKGSRTIAWMSVDDGCGYVTFYFAEKHRDALEADPALPSDLRATLGPVGRSIPVRFEVRDGNDAAAVAAVLAVKLRLK